MLIFFTSSDRAPTIRLAARAPSRDKVSERKAQNTHAESRADCEKARESRRRTTCTRAAFNEPLSHGARRVKSRQVRGEQGER